MKAIVLISFYRGEGGHKVHRIYLEQDFDQAEKDLAMIQEIEPLGKELELVECEVYKSE